MLSETFHGARMTPVPDPASRSLLLDNGLAVQLRHVPGAQRAAAALRVAAGSHDEPRDWPGLAHFLEHLLFLGGLRYPDQQRLMPFVQACGGRLNASTQARYTDFFFELPPARLEAGLARLLDMLGAPQLVIDAQLREREVLQAEYLARARDTWTQAQSALAAALAPGHPLADFHAGNRDSLAVEDPAFQAGLTAFHQAHYQGARMRLVLLGPQSLDELAGLAQYLAGSLPGGAPAAPRPAPALLPLVSHSLRMCLPGAARSWLAFALEGQPAALPQALEVLRELLQDEAEGSLQAWLAEQGLCDGLQLLVPHLDQDQALLVLDLALADARPESRARLEAALFHWLAALREQEPWRDLLARHQARAGHAHPAPLEQARSLLERGGDPPAPLEARDFARLLAQLTPPRLIRLFASEAAVAGRVQVAGFPLELEEEGIPPWPAVDVRWRFSGVPMFSPFEVTAARGVDDMPLLHHWGDAERAAVFLRWRLPTEPVDGGFFQALQRALRATQSRAQQQGVAIDFSEQGRDWRLSLRGAAGLLPPVLDAVLKTLFEPPLAACEQGRRLHRAWLNREAGELPIRQLLRGLPGRLDAVAAPRPDDEPVSPARLGRIWARTAWEVMAVGLDERSRKGLAGVLRGVPGWHLDGHAPAAPTATRRWHPVAVQGDAALLLFCPLPDRQAETEATWQWLARCLEAGFYQRLRSELQLGYAVFSGFRLINGHAGLLFGVQSPSATVAQVLGHIEAFLAGLDEALTDGEAPRQALLAQLRSGDEDAAERAWNLHLAGRAPDWPDRVADALEQAGRDDLLAALEALQQARGGWLALANAARPDSRWH
ncbi:pyrroloquinoline quinone biosynthesis protein PqqF [Pseudomonas sp. No.21]